MFSLALLIALLATSTSASAGTCLTRGYKVVKENSEATILTKPMRTGKYKNWRKNYEYPPDGIFACSHRFHRRVFLSTQATDDDAYYWMDPIKANYRFAAWVSGSTGNLDQSEASSVHLMDLRTGKSLGTFDVSAFGGAEDVRALAISPWGALGWIDDSETEDSEEGNHNVWLRTTGEPRLMASSSKIDPKRLRFGNTPLGRALIWSTGNSVTGSPAS